MRPLTFTLALLCLTPVCQASTITYSTQAAYNAATTGNTTIDFAGDTATSSTSIPSGTVTQGGVQFSIGGGNGNLYYINGLGPHYGTDTVLSSQQSSVGNNLTISLPGSYDDLSLLFNSFQNTAGVFTADPLTITLSDGYTFTSSPTPDGSYVFSGLTSTQSFNSVTITDLSSSNGVIDLAQLQFGAPQTSVTPEPSSLILLGTGVLGAAGAFRRRLFNR